MKYTAKAINGFWKLVDRNGPVPSCCPELGRCWIWIGSQDKKGYGVKGYDDNRGFAHRFSYELLRETIPIRLVLDHLCRIHQCVNPMHLEAVTIRENILRGEGITAKQFRLTHCKRGHELSEENIYRQPTKPTGRRCRECHRIEQRVGESKEME